jgi:hypothetical protein
MVMLPEVLHVNPTFASGPVYTTGGGRNWHPIRYVSASTLRWKKSDIGGSPGQNFSVAVPFCTFTPPVKSRKI